MKGYGSTYSPYVRKVRVTAIEIGMADAIEWEMVPPADRAAVITGANPLVKVPTVIRDDGGALFDSAVICEYLDSLHDAPKLFPPAGEGRWQALRLQALGDGIADATVAVLLEGRRPQEHRLAAVADRQTKKIDNGLDALEAEVAALDGPPTIGHIAVACAIGFLDDRQPDCGWRRTRPGLAAWYEAFARRPSMQATEPFGGPS